jgi:hypothetical protein
MYQVTIRYFDEEYVVETEHNVAALYEDGVGWPEIFEMLDLEFPEDRWSEYELNGEITFDIEELEDEE